MSYIVSIRCTTYNQSSYITDALNGFVMQQTDFPFVAVIIDDASTDGEQEVIKSYVEEHFDHSEKTGYKEWETEDAFWTFARHVENRNCHFIVVYLKKNLFGNPKKNEITKEFLQSKYIAFCEGDDYWTDPLKLQKQVDFLEMHESFVACCHNAIVKVEDTGEMKCFNNWFEQTEFDYEDIIAKDWFIPTHSLLYRRDVYQKNIIEKSFFNGDLFLQLCLTRTGGLIYYSNDCMGVYRRGVGVSKTVCWYDNNLRLIELFDYMKQWSDKKYEDAFDKRIEVLQKQNQRIKESERNVINANKLWYKIRFQLLRIFAKILCLNSPGVVLIKKY